MTKLKQGCKEIKEGLTLAPLALIIKKRMTNVQVESMRIKNTAKKKKLTQEGRSKGHTNLPVTRRHQKIRV